MTPAAAEASRCLPIVPINRLSTVPTYRTLLAPARPARRVIVIISSSFLTDYFKTSFTSHPCLLFISLYYFVFSATCHEHDACPSVTLVYIDHIVQDSAEFLISHEMAITSFLTPTVVGGRRHRPSETCAQTDPPLRKTPTSTDFCL